MRYIILMVHFQN